MTINFERAATLMDVVQKVASVAPAYTALSSIAMGELKEMNDTAQKDLDALGAERLKKEQEAQAAAEEARLASEPNPKVYVPETDAPQFPEDSTPVTRRV